MAAQRLRLRQTLMQPALPSEMKPLSFLHSHFDVPSERRWRMLGEGQCCWMGQQLPPCEKKPGSHSQAQLLPPQMR